jgi:hypothetical protein
MSAKPTTRDDARSLTALRQACLKARTGQAVPWLRLPLFADEEGRIWMNDGDALVDDQGRMEPEVAAFVSAAVNYAARLATSPKPRSGS